MKSVVFEFFERDRLALLLVGMAFFVTLISGTYHLSESPGIWYDEGYYTQLAMNLVNSSTQSIQTAPGVFVSSATVTGGFPLTIPVAFSYKLFGVGVFQGRAVMVLYIFALLATVYMMTRSLFSARIASWATLIVASFPLLYGNGKSVLGEIPGLFFVLLTLLSLIFLERSHYRSLHFFICAGLAAGFAVVTKPIFLLLLPALFLSYVFSIRSFSIRGCLLGITAFFIPFTAWIYLQFGSGDSLFATLSFYINPYESGNTLTLVGENLLHLVTGSTPLFMLGLLSLWSLAFLIRWRAKEYIYKAECAAFIFCLIIIAAYLRLPGWYRYLFPAALVALVFLPHSAQIVFNFFKKRFAFLEKKQWFLPVFLVGVVFLQLYQLAFTSYVAGYYDSHRVRDLRAYIASLDPSASFFLYNVPEIAVLLPSQNYFQYLQPHETKDSETLGVDTLPILASGQAEYVVVSDSFYRSNQSIFSAYGNLDHVNRYGFLKKR